MLPLTPRRLLVANNMLGTALLLLVVLTAPVQPAYPTCTDLSNLQHRVVDASVVIYGRISDIFNNVGKVEMEKVLKGKGVVDKLPDVQNMQGKRVVFIQGLNTPGDVCPSEAQRQQHKVFLVKLSAQAPNDLELQFGALDLNPETRLLVEEAINSESLSFFFQASTHARFETKFYHSEVEKVGKDKNGTIKIKLRRF